MYRKLKITLLLAALICVPLFSQQYEIYVETKEKSLPFGLKDHVLANKPVIAIALSGGGARGLAQIGVLRALEEAGIEIDLVVGTSMGSIVGGLYSAGYSIDDLDSIARSTDWADLLTFGTQSNRRDLFVDQKVTEDRAIFSLRLSGLNPVLPTSFNDGQKLSNYLNILTFDAPIHVDSTFDELKRRFRAVCTNLVTGEPVVIDKGSLSKAMRASSSVTFFLAPVQIDSLVLVDGGLVANIPSEIARKNNADFIIAVNTTSPLWNKQNLDAPWIIADQIVSIPMKTINEQQIKESDFVITPQLENIFATDFDKVDTLISLGYNEGKIMSGLLKEKIDSLYKSKDRQGDKYFFHPTVVGNLNDQERGALDYQNKDSVSDKQILKDLENLYLSGNYEKLGVNILATDSSAIICLDKTERPMIEDISLRGVSLINSEKISELFNPLRGNFYSANKISNALQELMSLYRRSGYSLAEVQEISFDEESKYLQIFIDEGIISRIEVTGNTNTDEDVITRELPFSEGDFFKIVNVEQGLKNLRSTKLFEDADVTVREDNGQNVLTVRVIEKPTSLLRLGLRVDNEYRAQIGLDIREENIFGTGAELGFIFFGGTRNRSYILEQKANRIFNTYFTYKINAFYKFNDVSVYRDEATNDDKRFSREKNGEYRQIYYGFSLGLGTQVERFGNLIAEGKYQIDEIKNIELSPANPYKQKIVSLKISSTVDTQDKFPYPERGIFFNGFYETAQTFLGGDVGFTSLGFEYKNYFKLGNKHVLSPKIQMSFGDKTLPLSQQYSIGGQESFFGMREYEFRGRQLFQVSLMYRYKFPFKIFFDSYFKARYDIGNVWEVQEQIRFKDLRQGIGAALSFDTPVGPAEFAVGRSFLFRKDLPENPISWGDVIFYFSIGYYY